MRKGTPLWRKLRRSIGLKPPANDDPPDLLVVEVAHQALLGREISQSGRRHFRREVERGATLGGMLLELAQSDEYTARAARAAAVPQDVADLEFVNHAYRTVLARDADPHGLRTYTEALEHGGSREDVLRVLIRSDEHVNRLIADLYQLPSLRALRPASYRRVAQREGNSILCFQVDQDVDFDWLEQRILQNNYYDKPGIWGFSLDEDKRTMADLLAKFCPQHVLEIGCANGAVLKALDELGIRAEGVEISQAAIDRAFPEIRHRIHRGDLLEVELNGPYDLIFGLDIFEHLNPNRLGDYLQRIRSLLAPNSFLFVNVPAYGHDPVFGTVFEPFLAEWEESCDRGERFSLIQVDEDGYPMHGHLIWAPSAWWLQKFADHGLHRDVAIERALHETYDEYFRSRSPARLAFFVLSGEAVRDNGNDVADRIRADSSAQLRR